MKIAGERPSDDVKKNKELYGDLAEYEKEKAKLFEILKEHTGDIPVYTYFEQTKEVKALARQWWITPTNDLITKLTNTFGFGNVKLV